MKEIFHWKGQAAGQRDAGRSTVKPYVKVKCNNCQSQLSFDNYYISDCATYFGLTRASSGTCIYKNIVKIVIHNNI
jgi:hypothetical protein